MNARKAVLADNPKLILRVLRLRFDEALSYPVISTQTGVSKTAIFSLVRRFHQVFTDRASFRRMFLRTTCQNTFPRSIPFSSGSCSSYNQPAKSEKPRRNRFSPEFSRRFYPVSVSRKLPVKTESTITGSSTGAI